MTVQQVRTQFITDYSNKGVRAFQRDLNTLGQSANKVGDQAGQGLGKIAKFSQAAGTALMVGVGAALAVGIKASIDFEDAFAGVRKTVDASEGTFQKLAREIRDMALEIPIAATELARIGELGGQLGVPTDALDDFIEVVAKLGVTTNLQTDEAATAVARFSEIMGSTDFEFENIASSLVELGNNFATTEKEILNFGTRLAGIGSTVGMTEGDVLGLATAFTHLGEPAERGATAVQRAFVSMFQAVNEGGEDLRTFAEVVGTTTTEFIEMFEEDPTEAFITFSEGLGRIIDEGGDVTSILQDLGLGSQRTLGAMLKAATGFDILEDAVRTGNEAFDENIALNEEAEERFGTMQSQIELLKNQFMELRLEIGDRATPAFKDLLGFLGGLFKVIGDNIGIVEKLFGVILLFTGAKGLLAVGKLAAGAAVGLGEMSTKMTGLGVAGLNAQGHLAKVGTVVRGLGGVIGAAAIALGLLAVAFGRNEQHASAYRDAIGNTLDTMEDFAEGTVHAQEVYEAFVEVLGQKTGIFDLPLDLEEYRDFVSGFGITTRELVDLAINDFDEFERVTTEITDGIKSQIDEVDPEAIGRGFAGPRPEDQQRMQQLHTWNRIITEITAATKSLREEEELRRKEMEIEGRERATAPGGPGAIGMGGPGLDFMEGVSSKAADIAFGIVNTREDYNEALANMIADTAEFTQEFADEWDEIVGEFNESLFDWETAFDEYESVTALGTSDLNSSIDKFIEDQRNRTAALRFVYEEFGEELGSVFASLPAEMQLRLGATLDDLGPEAFRTQMETIAGAWGDMSGLAIENAMIMAPTGARRAFEMWSDAFGELMGDLPEEAEEGTDAWKEAVLAGFEEFRVGLLEESPELADAFDAFVEEALNQAEKDHPVPIDIDEMTRGMTTAERLQLFTNMGFEWVDAVMLAWGTLPGKMGDTATSGAEAVKKKFPEGIEISSPSKVFERFGTFAAQGFEMGFANSLDKVSFKPNQPVLKLEAPSTQVADGPSITIVNPQHKDDDIVDGLQRASTLVGLTRMAEITRT